MHTLVLELPVHHGTVKSAVVGSAAIGVLRWPEEQVFTCEDDAGVHFPELVVIRGRVPLVRELIRSDRRNIGFPLAEAFVTYCLTSVGW